jgi:hypothetical protein
MTVSGDEDDEMTRAAETKKEAAKNVWLSFVKGGKSNSMGGECESSGR